MTEKKLAHQMSVGDEFEPFEFTVTPELNQQYMFAVEDFHPRYWLEHDSGAPLVHPALLLNMSNNARSPSYYLPPGVGNLQSHDLVQFLHHARVGKSLRVTWKVVDRYEKRGLVFEAREARMVDEDGVEILRRKLTGTFTQTGASEQDGAGE